MIEKPGGRRSATSFLRRGVIGSAAILAALAAGTRGTQDAVANGDTRTITILHEHTKESASITFRRHGQYDSEGLRQLNWLLRDWRLEEPTKMDPRLFDIVWEVYRSVGASEPIHVVSAYRSPQTNAALRRRSRAVSEFSQHMHGKAMDFYLPGVDMARVRAVGMRLQRGGVGFYPHAMNPFVHLDAGSVRSWPRMSRDQLARLFPDGRTVHLPTRGGPMPGYEEAKAEILSRGGAVAGYAAYAEAGESSGGGRSLWSMLFGGGGEDEDAEYYRTQNAVAAKGRGRTLSGRAAPVQATAYAAPASSNADDAGMRDFLLGPRSAEPSPAGRSQAGGAPLAQVASASPEGGFLAALVRPPAAPAPAPEPAPAEEPAALRGPALAVMPMPPRRPDDLAGASLLALAPLPPARPIELASADPDAVPALAAAALDPPRLRTASIQRDAPADDDRAHLRALFTAVASGATPAASQVRVTAATKRDVAPPAGLVGAAESGVAQRFSGPALEAPTGRFSGPAVRPLPR